jgi:hypothetical protein
MNVVVHMYLTGVRKVQRNIRDFIACKHAKITVLAVLWARLEKSFVKSMLDQRKLQKRNTGTQDQLPCVVKQFFYGMPTLGLDPF